MEGARGGGAAGISEAQEEAGLGARILGGGGGAVPARLSVALAASVSSARRRRLASHPLITLST